MDKVATVLPSSAAGLGTVSVVRAGAGGDDGRHRAGAGTTWDWAGAEGLQGAGAGGLAGWMAAGRRQAGQDRHETGTSQPSDRA